MAANIDVTFPKSSFQSGELFTFTITNPNEDPIPGNTLFNFRVQSPNLKPDTSCRVLRQIEAHDLPIEHGFPPEFRCVDLETNTSYNSGFNPNPQCADNGTGYASFAIRIGREMAPGLTLTCYAAFAVEKIIPSGSTITVEDFPFPDDKVVTLETSYSIVQATEGTTVSKSKPWQFYTTVTASRPGLFEVFVRTQNYVWDTSIYDEDNFYCRGNDARVVYINGKLLVHFTKADTSARCLFGVKKATPDIILNTDVIDFSIFRDSIKRALTVTHGTDSGESSFSGYVTSNYITVEEEQVNAPMAVVHFTIPTGTPKGTVFYVAFRADKKDVDVTPLTGAFAARFIQDNSVNTIESDETQRSRFTFTSGRVNEYDQLVTVLFQQTTPVDMADLILHVDITDAEGVVLNSSKSRRIELDYRTTWKLDEIWAMYKEDDPFTFQFGATVSPTYLSARKGATLSLIQPDYFLDVSSARCKAQDSTRVSVSDRRGHLFVNIDSDVARDANVVISCDVPARVAGHLFDHPLSLVMLPANYAGYAHSEIRLATLHKDDLGPLVPPEPDEGAYALDNIATLQDGNEDDEEEEPPEPEPIEYPITVTGWTFAITVDLSGSDYDDFSLKNRPVRRAVEEFYEHLLKFTMGDVQSPISPFSALLLEDLYYVRLRNRQLGWSRAPHTIYEAVSVYHTSNYRVQVVIGLPYTSAHHSIDFNQLNQSIQEYFANQFTAKKVKYFLHEPVVVEWAGLYPICKGTDSLGSPRCGPKYFGDKCTAHAECYTAYCAPSGYCGQEHEQQSDVYYYSLKSSAALLVTPLAMALSLVVSLVILV